MLQITSVVSTESRVQVNMVIIAFKNFFRRASISETTQVSQSVSQPQFRQSHNAVSQSQISKKTSKILNKSNNFCFPNYKFQQICQIQKIPQSLESREIFRASGIDFPMPPLSWRSTDTSQIAN